ncbi:ABC transporter substrate-binding protein [Agrobacterium vitis]|uniref:Peptide ABC transporter n=1 Tax=Agrobacterium vitis TaxID=373 RepID=A0A368NGS3_AGRVI|nr:ABC transporter substrate-binding protein [Agrobacterium vitis]MCF1501923.1 peptide ABC transporter [Allorhizobium sp. Av2]KAA3509305.1 peptide ABC transporter [Agrobacterium vitis]KAA3522342.1 peptide ABC transporter [Agrobacterium vitis]MCF1479523.1 peptide ABC transporter [Agrobacterium vitis]MCM2443410.1 ABC transporter substrate-binding protein [Agrobacterium vitis]
MKRRTFIASTALVIASLAAGAAVAQEDNRRDLRIAVQKNPETQEPVDQASNAAFRNNPSIHETLLKLDLNDYTVRPNLAISWKWIDDTTLEIKLRKGVIFHDSREMTADDVAFSFGPERLTDPKAPGYPTYLTSFSSLDHVDVVDPETVRFVTKFKDPVLLQRLANYSAVVISKDAWVKMGGDWVKWKQKPIGAGPYKVIESIANDHVTLAAHDLYFGGKPNAKTVTFKVVPEVSSRIAGLLAGDYDIVTDLPPDQLDVVNKSNEAKIVGGPVPNNRILFYDKNNPVLKDPRVRQALSLAIDRQAIVDSIWDGKTVVPNGAQFKEFGPIYLKDRPKPEYNPEKAQQLLKDAGYNGEQITIRSQNNYYTAENPVSEAIVAMWQAVGINAKLEFVEAGKLFENTNARATGNWSSTAIVSDPYVSVYALSFAKTATMGTQKIWENPEFDALGAKLEQAIDPADRAKIFSDMLDIIELKDPGITVLHQNAVFYGISNKLKWEPKQTFAMDLGAQSLSFANTTK